MSIAPIIIIPLAFARGKVFRFYFHTMRKSYEKKAKLTRGVLATVSGDILFINVTKNGIIRRQREVKAKKSK